MHSINILNKSEEKEIIKLLNESFGIEKLPESSILLQTSREKISLFTGDLPIEKIIELNEVTFIELIGVYLGRTSDYKDKKEIRLSIEGSQLLGEQATKNIVELNEKQMLDWMKGQELDIQTSQENTGFKLIKYKDYFLGTGKASENKISNFVPKERRLKERS